MDIVNIEQDLISEAEAHKTRAAELHTSLLAERDRLKARLIQVNGLLGRKPRGPKAPTAKKDGTPRKTRGPNKPKSLGAYVPKSPLATGIEKAEQA